MLDGCLETVSDIWSWNRTADVRQRYNLSGTAREYHMSPPLEIEPVYDVR